MNTIDLLWLAWPWVGAGGALVLLLMLFFTDSFRSDKSVSRWFDPVWLAWMMVVAYLLHVWEEYGLHIADGQFQLITSFHEMGVDAKFGGIPNGFFPYVNIGLTWVALPIAALLCKRYPVIGLGGMGFLALNGLTHIGAGLALGQSLSENAGVVTGVLVFIPLFCWICYACASRQLLPKGGLTIAIVSGVIAICYYSRAMLSSWLLGI